MVDILQRLRLQADQDGGVEGLLAAAERGDLDLDLDRPYDDDVGSAAEDSDEQQEEDPADSGLSAATLERILERLKRGGDDREISGGSPLPLPEERRRKTPARLLPQRRT